MPKITKNGGPSSLWWPDLSREQVEYLHPELVRSAPVADAVDYATLSFKTLRDLARERGLATGGTTSDLIQRLEAHDAE